MRCRWPVPGAQAGVGFLSTSRASLGPADLAWASLAHASRRGRRSLGCPPWAATSPSLAGSARGASSSQGQGLVPPLPGPSCMDVESTLRVASFMWNEGPECAWETAGFHGVCCLWMRWNWWRAEALAQALGSWSCRRTLVRSQLFCRLPPLGAASTLVLSAHRGSCRLTAGPAPDGVMSAS